MNIKYCWALTLVGPTRENLALEPLEQLTMYDSTKKGFFVEQTIVFLQKKLAIRVFLILLQKIRFEVF